MMEQRAVQKNGGGSDHCSLIPPWRMNAGVLLWETTTTVQQFFILKQETSPISMNIQMYFSLIELCLFCSQIIVSQMFFLNRSLSYHKYKQSHVQVSVEQDLH